MGKLIPSWQVDDIFVGIELDTERCKCMLNILLNDFCGARLDQKMRNKFIAEWDEYRILLEVALLECCHIYEQLRKWEKLSEEDTGKK